MNAVRTIIAPAIALLALGASTATTHAQQRDEWDVQLFRPAIHSLSSFTTESARVSHELTVNAFVMFNYAHGLLQDNDDVDIVEGIATTNLVASIGFLDHLSFGFDVPIYFGGTGTDVTGDDLIEGGVGDIRLSIKGTALKPWRIGPGIGIGLDLHLPSGSKGAYHREEGVVVVPKILLDAVTRHVHLMTNIWFFVRTNEFSPQAQQTAAGGTIDFDDDLAISSDVGISTALAIFLGSTDFRMNIEGRFASRLARFFEPQNTQLELTWGLHWRHQSGFAVGGGASFGVLAGYGDPDWRAFLQVGYQPGKYLPMPVVQKVVDTDGDGILDDVDQCPTEKEDFDGFEDADGCPDNDNDGDGVPDSRDKCPTEKEDIDNWEDDDGCPEADNDGDGILDNVDKCPNKAEDFDGDRDEDGCPDGDGDKDGIPDDLDKCPTQPEDIDGFEDADGCPDPDNDGDGILDVNDKCPLDAEDKDGFQDGDGCPDPDNDGDGIADATDKCPDQAEDFDGCQDDDGCPEAGRVCVTKEKIVITEKIFFDTGKAKIKTRSFSLLQEIADTLKANPQIKRVEIQGHTDSRGSDSFNLKLSDARARSVYTHLVTVLGIDPARLTSRGYGEEQPIGSNDTADGRELNRRVEFVIREQDPVENK